MVIIRLFKFGGYCQKLAMCKLFAENSMDRLSFAEAKKIIDSLDNPDNSILIELNDLETAIHYCNKAGLYGYRIIVEKINKSIFK